MSKMLAKTLENKFVQCIACNRRCRIPDGHAGYCGVRVNEKGKLKLIVHSRPVSMWADPVEKKPLFHFLPGTKSFSIGTLGCNFSCDFCQNWDISQAPHEAKSRDPKHWREYFQNLVERMEYWPPEKIAEAAAASNCQSISFTYNEPVIFTEYAMDVMKIAKKHGMKGIYVTNGYGTKECWDMIKGSIDAVNIDLKAFNQEFYTKLCKVPEMEHIKDSIKYAREIGIWVEVTTLIIPGWNDKVEELRAAAKWLASVDPTMPWHVTAFHPDYKMLQTPPTPPEILVKARQMGEDAGIEHVYCGNLPRGYHDYETTSCPKCKADLITRYGMSVSENKLVDGKCHKCGTKVNGVWK